MTLRRWQHAGLSVAITVLVGIMLWAISIKPLNAYYHAQLERLAETQVRLGKFRQLARTNGLLKTRVENEKSLGKIQYYFFPSMSVSLAAAKLQEKVKPLVKKHQGELISTQVLPSKAGTYLTPVEIRVNIKTDISGLQALLYQLEASRPLTYINNLRIQYRGAARQLSGEDAASKPITLNVQFNLKSYMLTLSGSNHASP